MHSCSVYILLFAISIKTAKLVTRTLTTQNLAGTVHKDGNRQGAILDNFLPADEASFVLANAADLLQREAYDRSKSQSAALLYMLAGRYGSVLALLNSLIAPPDKQDGDQMYVPSPSSLF